LLNKAQLSIAEHQMEQQALEGNAPPPMTDWDRIYALRRTRDRIKERRIEREKDLGLKRPRRPLHR
jgi:hypothetical protein